MSRIPFLNIDLGELVEEPEELYALAQLANIACGGHAGDAASMEHALRACKREGTRAGAHPSYPDREHFGRRSLDLEPLALHDELLSQLESLASIARRLGIELFAVKPHGALYHDADRDPALAAVVVDAVVSILGAGAAIVGPPGGSLAVAAFARGSPFLREGFADRGLLPDGRLIPRGQPGALLDEPAAAAAQAAKLAAAGCYDTLCVHGDTRGSVGIAAAVRRALAEPAPEARR